MPKRKSISQSSKLPFLLGVLVCAGAVWALADYVKVAHADKVPASEHRASGSSRRSRAVQGSTIDDSGKLEQVLVFSPVKDSAARPMQANEKFEFTSQLENVPSGEDPMVFAVNSFLQNAKVTDPEGKVMAIDLNDGLATIHFNAPMNHTLGEDDESYLLNGIDKTLAQFPDVKKVEYYAEGERIKTFGSVDVSEPLPVNEESVLASAKHSRKPAASSKDLSRPSQPTKG